MAFDIYATITERIIAELENGTVPWRKPWVGSGGAISHVTGKPYSLLNQFLLGKPGEYLTFKQCADEGGHVKKGTKAKFVVFWKWLDKKDGSTVTLPDGRIVPEQVPYLRYYNVFHIDQCEGISPKWDKPLETHAQPDEKAEAIIQAFIQREGIKLNICRSDQAFYDPRTDSITVPELSQYAETSEYVGTLAHEAVHASGHPSRLNRFSVGSHAFGSAEYSLEECVAECGAAFLLSYVGLETPASFRNNAAYIRGWLKTLNGDKRLIVRAAGQAEKAVRYILGEEAEQNDP